MSQRKRNNSKYLLIGLAFVFLIILSLSLIEFVDFSFFKISKVYKVELGDECGIVLGNLVHQIRDETDCNLRCNSRCEVEDSNFIESEFIKSNSSCHTCNCYCK